MAPDDVTVRLRRKLEEVVGVEETDLLLDRPPGGWGELVTKEWLHLELSVVGARIDGLASTMEAQFVGVGQQVASIDARFAAIDARFAAIDARFAAIDARFAMIDDRFAMTDQRFMSIDTQLRSIDAAIRAQTWKLVGAMTGLFAAFVAAIKL